MARSIIGNVHAVPDAVDRLAWEVDVRTDFFTSRHQVGYALFWEGQVTFWRESVPAGSMPGPQTPRKSLPARWANRDKSARFTVPNEHHFEFATDLPGDALEKIEAFREGGRLYARIEGTLGVVLVEPRKGEELVGAMLMDLGRVLVDSSRAHTAQVRTDPKELSRDSWCDDVLGKLRPQGRHVVEVTVPIGSIFGDAAAAALEHQRAAQRHFDAGRYEETVHVCARALDQTSGLLDKIQTNYGNRGRESVAQQIEAIRSVCDPALPAQRSPHGALRVDRALAQYVLIATSAVLVLATS